MEIIIVAIAILAVAGYFILRKSKDIPESVVKTEQSAPVVEPVPLGTEASVFTVSIDTKPVEAKSDTITFVPPVTTAVKEANILDINNDGKVNLEDAKEAVKQTVAKAKTAATKARKKK
jgi:hypothetical protein|tara:strand:+ start:902 stop:1258 length:357 start_codon:yes stop_codon:yes gene_type:complete